MKTPFFNRDGTPKSRYIRGMDTISTDSPVKIGLETIDSAILSYLQNKIKPVVTQDNKQINVPVIYGSPERWKSAQIDGAIRDQNGKIQLPLAMIRRTQMEKSPISSPVNKYTQYTYKTRWNSRNMYDKYMNRNNVTPSEQFVTVAIPDFYKLTYETLVWTEYMDQMNSVIEAVSFEDNEYWGKDNNYRFVTNISNYQLSTELPTNNDRMVRTKFNIEVNAYILPESTLNADGNRASTIRMQYGPKKVVFNSEIVTELKNN